MGNLAMNVSCT